MSDRSDPQSGHTPEALAFFQERFDLGDSSLATALDTALERRLEVKQCYHLIVGDVATRRRYTPQAIIEIAAHAKVGK